MKQGERETAREIKRERDIVKARTKQAKRKLRESLREREQNWERRRQIKTGKEKGRPVERERG